MNPENDPRLGLPSGSSALEDSLCPGRWRAQREFAGLAMEEEREAGDPGDLDRDAEAGKRIHRLYAGESCPEATEPERRRAQQALDVDTRMHNRWAEFFSADPPAQIVALREHRWWYKGEDGQPLYSGQTDLVKIRGTPGGEADVLLADLKGLWGYHDSAVLNKQIQRYIALISVGITDIGYTGLRSACAYLNQPAATLSPELAQYDSVDIGTLVFQMQMEIAAMMDPDAPRTAGPVQCHHCLAKLFCVEYQEALAQLPVPIPVAAVPAPAVPTKENLTDLIAKLPGEKLAALLPWLPALDNTVSLAKSEAKRRLRQDAFSVPGYLLKKNPPRSKVTDLLELWKRLSSKYPITAEEFVKLCSITKQNVEEVARVKSGLKGKALDAVMETLLKGCTMPIQISDSLEERQPDLLGT